MTRDAEQAISDCTSIKNDRNFVFRTTFNPIQGVDEDIAEFVSRFKTFGSLRFSKFAEIWKREQFIEIIHGRRHQAALYDILGCIFHRLVQFMLPESGKKQIERICALYMLYAFYGKQPVKNHVRIRVCPNSWKAILQLATEARDEGHLDVYYVFRQLCALNAFAFCATRQILYPGAPLFDSPQVTKEPPAESSGLPSNTERPCQTRSRSGTVVTDSNPLSPYFQLLQFPKSSRPTLDNALKSLDAGLLSYTEAKRTLNPPTEMVSRRDRPENQDGSGEDSDEAEEFLPGLNFITYPGCLKKVFITLRQLQESEDNYKQPKIEPIDPGLESDERIDHTEAIPGGTQNPGVSEAPGTSEPVASTSACTPRKHRPISNVAVESTTDTSGAPIYLSVKQEDMVDDVGERRRLLRQPSTWSAELAAQAEAVRALGHHRDRRRPTEPKILKRLRDRPSR